MSLDIVSLVNRCYYCKLPNNETSPLFFQGHMIHNNCLITFKKQLHVLNHHSLIKSLHNLFSYHSNDFFDSVEYFTTTGLFFKLRNNYYDAEVINGNKSLICSHKLSETRKCKSCLRRFIKN